MKIKIFKRTLSMFLSIVLVAVAMCTCGFVNTALAYSAGDLDGKYIYLRASNGYYITYNSTSGYILEATATSPSNAMKFLCATTTVNGVNYLTIRNTITINNQYLYVYDNGTSLYINTSTTSNNSDYCRFQVGEYSNNGISLKSKYYSKYATLDTSTASNYIKSTATTVGSTEKLYVVEYDNTNGKFYDLDSDSINDYLELSGYYKNGSTLSNHIPNYTTPYSYKVYYTNPNDTSSDGDPYSDYNEAMENISGVGNYNEFKDPMVAAYPNIKVELTNIVTTPNGTITSSNGGSNAKTSSSERAEENTDTNAYGGSISSTTSVKANLDPLNPFEVEEAVTISNNYTHTDGTSTTTTSSTGATDTTDWSKATATNPSQAATLGLTVKYVNNGTAPIYNIKPIINMYIGGVLAKTFVPNLALSVDPDSETSEYVVEYDNSNNPLYITLSQYDAITKGASITMDVVGYNSGSLNSNTSDNGWVTYLTNINSRCATIVTDIDGTEKVYKVYAGDSDNDIAVTLQTALEHALRTRLTTDGSKYYIDGNDISKLVWAFSNRDYIFDQLKAGTSLTNCTIKPGLTVLLKENSGATTTIPYARYSSDNDTVYATVNIGDYELAENSDGTERVYAKVKVNGTVQDIQLTNNEGIYSAALGAAADTSYNGLIYAYISDGTYVTQSISSETNGYYYVPLSSPKEILSATTTKGVASNSNDYIPDISAYSGNAKSYVLQVESSRLSSNDAYVKIADRYVYTGTGDSHRKYKFTLIDNGNSANNVTYEGYGSKDFKSYADFGAKNDIYDAIRFESGCDSGYVAQVFGDATYKGWSETYSLTTTPGSAGTTWTFNHSNAISSMRIVDIGGTTEDTTSTWSLQLGDGTNTKTITGTGAQTYSSHSAFGIANDKLRTITNLNPSSTANFKIELYQNDNFGGICQVFKDSMNLDSLGYNMGVSSIKITPYKPDYNPGAYYSPAMSKVVVVEPTSSGLPIKWYAGSKYASYSDGKSYADFYYKVKVLGYFTKNSSVSDATGFMPVTNMNEETLTLGSTDTKVIGGISGANGYLVELKNTKVSSDAVVVNLNGVQVNLGTADTNTSGQNSGGDYQPTRTEVVFVPADTVNYGDNIGYTAGIGSWAKNRGCITAKIIGYFDETGGYTYVPNYQSSKMTLNDSVFGLNPFYSGTMTYSGTGTPKGYIVQIKSKNSTPDLKIKFYDSSNNTLKEVYVGNGLTKSGNGGTVSSPYNIPTTSTLAYVPAAVTNPGNLNIWADYSNSNGPAALSDLTIDILGIFQ